MLLPVLSATGTVTIAQAQRAVSFMKLALLAICLILVCMLICSIVFTVAALKSRRRKSAGSKVLLVMLYVTTLTVLACAVICVNNFRSTNDALLQAQAVPTPPVTQPTHPSTTPVPSTEPTVPPTEPEPTLQPVQVDSSNPKNLGINWEIISGGEIVDSFQRPEPITFGKAEAYTTMEGIITFRGDNYRTGASYGTAEVTEKTLTEKWVRKIGSLNGWPGSGWTGQPLVVRWDEPTKSVMNLYTDKRSKADLVEVIYATLDGYVYFYDLDDGTYTRDPIYLGMNFKGAGSLDPRGYPLMYVGSGDNFNGKVCRMYIVSLVDGSILYEQSGADDFRKRPWCAFDSAPLVDAETDTLIWPGESGILYTMKLNTAYDQAAGTLSVNPEEVAKTRYTTNTGRTLGCESSSIIVENYLYIADNGGVFFCIDLNTMELIWAVDTKDDTNATPVFEWGDDGIGYIYTATSMEFGGGTSYIYKINANTGEIVWTKSYSKIQYDSNVSGGILSSPILGKEGTSLEGLIIYSVSKTPNPWQGILVALDTQTGEVVWEYDLDNYAWSSPVAIYTDSADAYILIFDSVGRGRLISAAGELLSTVSVGTNVEASPIVFDNTVVIGTRGSRVYALTIS